MMLLDSDRLANIIGGRWFNLNGRLEFTGIRVNIDRLEPGNLCFTTKPEQWGQGIPDTEQKLTQLFANGAIAAVVTDDKLAMQTSFPLLVVPDAYKALESSALAIRDSLAIQRVLVTGTEGKTGFKNQLYSLLSSQTKVHATLDSSNLNVPILCSLASVSADTRIEIIEASVAQANVGLVRSNLVNPTMCVITEVGFEHISTHGSFQNLINNKASIVAALQKNGLCILNAASANYDLVREAIYRRKWVDIKTFGYGKKCNARLLASTFNNDTLTWEVEATIEGEMHAYQVPLLGEHAPLASASVLLAIHHLGFNVGQATCDYLNIKSADTMGKLSKITAADKTFTIYDHSHRASVLSYASALKDLARLKPTANGRKIAVIGNMLNIGDISQQAHEDLAPLIEAAGVDRLYTVGAHAVALHGKLSNPAILIKHADAHQDIEAPVLADIQDGDLIFIKGHHRIWLKFLAEKIYTLGSRHEIR